MCTNGHTHLWRDWLGNVMQVRLFSFQWNPIDAFEFEVYFSYTQVGPAIDVTY
jgi:hypothetical protein